MTSTSHLRLLALTISAIGIAQSQEIQDRRPILQMESDWVPIDASVTRLLRHAPVKMFQPHVGHGFGINKAVYRRQSRCGSR
jgi:hypothetical protein